MGVKIYEHEPSRHLFMGIADAADALANAPDASEEMVEALFALEREYHPLGVRFEYMIPDEDNLKVDLDGQFVYDAKFFLPSGLEPASQPIRSLYFNMIGVCERHRRTRGVPDSDRANPVHYLDLGLKIGPKSRALVHECVAQLRSYFLQHPAVRI